MAVTAEICILETALPIHVAELPIEMLESIAGRPYMEYPQDRNARMAQAEVLREAYADYNLKRHLGSVARWNNEAEKASLGLFMKRRKVDQH